MYLKKDGTTTWSLPDLDDYVEMRGGNEDLSVEHYFYVLTYQGEAFASANCVGEDVFPNYPTKEQIKWCLLKHHAAYAQVVKLYNTVL